jgi:hypothetical protein
MTRKTRLSCGTSLARVRRLMRSPSWLATAVVLGVATFAGTARAQTMPTMSPITINTTAIARSVNPPMPTSPIGIRECQCGTWSIPGTVNVPSGTTSMQLWVGTTDTACATAMNRISTSAPTNITLPMTPCWQVRDTNLASMGVTGGTTIPLNLLVPARWMVDPINGNCQTLPNRNAMDTLYLSVVLQPPADNSPVGSLPFSYNIALPPAPTSVTALAQENGAFVSWTIGTAVTTDEAGTAVSNIPENVQGYFVLCTPQPNNFDAGLADACESGSVVGTDVVAADTATAPDAGTDAGMDGGESDAEAGVDDVVAMDTGTGGGMDVIAPGTDSGGASSCVSAFPANFNPNDDAQLARFLCSPTMISRLTTNATIAGLTNRTGYQFAVVTVDTSGNRSALSPISPCTVPVPVTDFWEQYRRDGGHGHTGLCSAHPGTFGAPGVLLVAFGGVVVAVVVRRRRRRARRGQDNGATQ